MSTNITKSLTKIKREIMKVKMSIIVLIIKTTLC